MKEQWLHNNIAKNVHYFSVRPLQLQCHCKIVYCVVNGISYLQIQVCPIEITDLIARETHPK